MAIDPKLVSIRQANQLPVSDPSENADFLFYEGEDLKRSPMDNIYDKVSSGLLPATTSTVPSATGFERYIVHTAGTYTNFLSGGSPIVVTESDLDVVNGVANNEVILEVSNGVSTKRVRRLKGDAQDLSAVITITDAVYKTFTLAQGYNTETGAPSTSSVNWLRAINIAVTEGENIHIEGVGSISTAKRVIFFNSTTQNASTFVSSSLLTELTVPTGAVSMVVNVSASTNAAADIPNSPYNQTLKIWKGTVKESFVKGESIRGDIETDQIKEIEEQIFTNRFFDGSGAPASTLGNNGDKYIDKSSLRIYIKENESWGLGSFLGGERDFNYPDDFTFRPFPLVRQGNSFYNLKGFTNVRDQFVQSYIDTLTPYYVDAVNGNDNNSGLSAELAFKRIYTAVVTKGARLVYIIGNEGCINEYSGMKSLTDIATDQPLIFIGVGNVILGGSKKANLLTWTANSGCWQAPITTVQNVMDFGNLDSDGIPTELTEVTSVVLCQSTPNSYYNDSTTLYVHPINNAAPTKDIEIFIVDNNSYRPTENVPFVYFENIGFATNVPMGAMAIRTYDTTQFNTKAYFYKCYGFNNKYGNIFSINNIKECWVQDCKGYKPKNDVFNYHTTNLPLGFLPMKVVEINCFGKNAGLGYTAETSSNLSTMHEGGTIMRMNSVFENGRGGNIADVNDGIRSLNLNIKSTGNSLETGYSFLVQNTNSKMWLYDCIGHQSLTTQFSVGARLEAVAYYKDSDFNKPFDGDVTAL